MSDRLITRSQQMLRAFFGLGPEQFSFGQELVPTFDVDKLFRSPQDAQILFGQSAAIAPGAVGSVTVSIPRTGTWLVHAISVATTGPGTSGSCRMIAQVNLAGPIWGAGGSFGLFDELVAFTRLGGNPVAFGRWFDTPIVMARNVDGIADDVTAWLENVAGAVGNAQVFVTLLARQIEAVVRS